MKQIYLLVFCLLPFLLEAQIQYRIKIYRKNYKTIEWGGYNNTLTTTDVTYHFNTTTSRVKNNTSNLNYETNATINYAGINCVLPDGSYAKSYSKNGNSLTLTANNNDIYEATILENLTEKQNNSSSSSSSKRVIQKVVY